MSIDKYIKSYEKIIEQFLQVQHSKDNEGAHIIQDKIYKKFIKDVSSNKFKSIEEAMTISKKINKSVIKYDKDRWYS
jgi:hypothetical protein